MLCCREILSVAEVLEYRGEKFKTSYETKSSHCVNTGTDKQFKKFYNLLFLNVSSVADFFRKALRFQKLVKNHRIKFVIIIFYFFKQLSSKNNNKEHK